MTLISWLFTNSRIVFTAISAASFFGKPKTPVEIQQKATDLIPLLHSKLQTGIVTACKQIAMLLCEPALNDRPDRVYHMVTGQIIRRSDLRLPRRFFKALLPHDLVTFKTQTNSRKGVYTVVDTVVTW